MQLFGHCLFWVWLEPRVRNEIVTKQTNTFPEKNKQTNKQERQTMSEKMWSQIRSFWVS